MTSGWVGRATGRSPPLRWNWPRCLAAVPENDPVAQSRLGRLLAKSGIDPEDCPDNTFALRSLISSMKLNSMYLSVSLAGLVAALAGCSSATSSRTPVYTQAEIGQAISQQSGEILSVRDVIIAPNSTVSRGAQGAGSRIGGAAVVGAITGSPLAIASAVGSVVGEAGGSKLDNARGEEITVQLKDGQVVTVVQERSDPPMAPGERVIVVTTGSSANLQRVRVTRTDPLGDPVPLAKAQ